MQRPENFSEKKINANAEQGGQSPPDIAAGKFNKGILKKRRHNTKEYIGEDNNI